MGPAPLAGGGGADLKFGHYTNKPNGIGSSACATARMLEYCGNGRSAAAPMRRGGRQLNAI